MNWGSSSIRYVTIIKLLFSFVGDNVVQVKKCCYNFYKENDSCVGKLKKTKHTYSCMFLYSTMARGKSGGLISHKHV